MNWGGVFTKISSLREGTGGQNKNTPACWVCSPAAGGNHRNGTWTSLALVLMHACVCMQGGVRSQNAAPHPPPHTVCSAVPIRGSELAVSQEVPHSLWCHFPRSTEEKGRSFPVQSQAHT